MPEQKHIIWSNIDLDLDDWYDDLHEEYPALGEEGLRDMMYQYNFEYFSDAQSQLDMYVGSPILVLANLGLWDGRHRGFGEIKSGNIKDCMETDYEYAEWYVDENGEFASRQIHHDGTNYERNGVRRQFAFVIRRLARNGSKSLEIAFRNYGKAYKQQYSA